MKKVSYVMFALLFLFTIQLTFAQSIVRLGDLPMSDYSINIFQVYGFHEGYEGYKITFIDHNNEPQHLYLPIELRDKYRVYRPIQATQDQNFIIIWKKGESIQRIEWFMPTAVDYDMPNFVIKAFGDKDKQVFEKIVDAGELMLGVEIEGIAPVIRAPGGE